MWLVAGVGFKAFQTVNGQVLIALALSAEPKFVMLAQASVFPKSAPPAGDPLEYALLVLDIVLRAEIDPVHGTIICGSELTPRSFILHRSCQLTGCSPWRSSSRDLLTRVTFSSLLEDLPAGKATSTLP